MCFSYSYIILMHECFIMQHIKIFDTQIIYKPHVCFYYIIFTVYAQKIIQNNFNGEIQSVNRDLLIDNYNRYNHVNCLTS